MFSLNQLLLPSAKLLVKTTAMVALMVSTALLAITLGGFSLFGGAFVVAGSSENLFGLAVGGIALGSGIFAAWNGIALLIEMYNYQRRKFSETHTAEDNQNTKTQVLHTAQ